MSDKAFYAARSIKLHEQLDAATDSATAALIRKEIDENIFLLNNAPGEASGAAVTLVPPPPPTVK